MLSYVFIYYHSYKPTMCVKFVGFRVDQSKVGGLNNYNTMHLQWYFKGWDSSGLEVACGYPAEIWT